MSKKEFMIQYVLNRASTTDNLDGKGAAIQAELAWEQIIKTCYDIESKRGETKCA